MVLARTWSSRLPAYARACRPEQWAKNVFVLLPALFGGRIADPHSRGSVIAVFACFCLLSSAIYIFNDIHDVSSDRAHPRKRTRPIASGAVSIFGASVLIVLLLGSACGIAALLPVGVWIAAACYVGNSVVYCLWLKHRVIVDVLLIALGFVIRLLAGCAAVDVEASSWLLLCGFSLALVLGFGKRRTEVEKLGGQTETRAVLLSYDAAKLNTLLAATTAVCLLTYALYTTAPDTVARHRTNRLIFTVPLVTYGLFRYLFKSQEGRGDGPTEILLWDKAFWLTGILWVVVVVLVLHVWPGS